MTARNALEIEHRERFDAVLAARDRGLLTFANHVSLLDDPLLVSCLGVDDYDRIRWVAADARNFFGDRLRGHLFSAGKCVPIVRGAGTSQPGFAFLRERLRAGEWVHLFPEGGRTRDPAARLRRPFKSGIGRLIDETRPVALPFYHHGMADVLPIGARWPRRGQRVVLRFGAPVVCDDDWVARTAGAAHGGGRWQALADWAEGRLAALEVDVRG